MGDDCSQGVLEQNTADELKELLHFFSTLDREDEERLLAYIQGATFMKQLSTHKQMQSAH